MTEPADRSAERRAAVAGTVARVRAIEREHGVNKDSLERIKNALLELAARRDLFRVEDFPPGDGDAGPGSCLYRISEDEDHRFALYLNVSGARYDTPPHNHTTWAVIAGIDGEERNRFYRRSADGVEQTGEDVVRAGRGVTFLPDELHSIHLAGDRPVINFHMYGLALEQLHEREYYSRRDRAWKTFPPQRAIREAR